MARETLRYLRSIPYDVYMGTRHWAKLRARVLAKWEGKCARCGGPATQAHHKTYARRGEEEIYDLLAVCELCHRKLHARAKPKGKSGHRSRRHWKVNT